MNWFFKNPLYFKILCLFEIKESKQNFCAIRCGKQIIEYNPDILETMTVAEIRNLLIAELNRIILRHPYRKKPNSCYDTLWYEASDITIKQEKILKYNFPANHNMEYYYNELKKIKEEDIEISPNGNSSMLGMQTDTTDSDDTNNNESGDNNIKKDSEESKNQKQQSKNEESQKNQEEQNSKETNEKSTEDYSDNEDSDKNEKSFNDKTDDEKDLEQNQTSVKNLKPFEDNENLEEKGVENQSARNTEKSEEEEKSENQSFGASENSDEKTSENKSADNSEKSKEEKTSIIFSLENSENSEEESQNLKENQSKNIDNFDEISQKSINNTKEKNNQDSENYQNDKNQNTDINVLLGPTGLWGEDVIQNQRIESYVVEAIQQKSWGTTPHDIIQQIEIEYKKNYPDCKRILKYLNAKIKQTNRVLTRTKPSRRFGFSQMGSIYKPRPSKLLVFIDSSGSIAPKLLKKFLLTIKSIFSRTIKEIDMFFFDTELKSKEPIKTKVYNMHKIDVIGRGGTNFECIFEYIKKNQNKYDGILIFTDGYAPEVNLKFKLRTKLCWIIYDNEGVQPWMKKIGLCSIMQKKVAKNE
jgi:predicted metal-dependent peptidase